MSFLGLFDCLPDELVELIFSFFSTKDAVKIDLVSREFHELCWYRRRRLEIISSLFKPKISDQLLQRILWKTPQLKELVLKRCPVTNDIFVYLSVLTNLQNLSLELCKQITDLYGIGQHTRLRRINLALCNISQGDFEEFASLPNLEYLNLKGGSFYSVSQWTFLDQLTNLNELVLSRVNGITVPQLQLIAKLTRLECLHMQSLTPRPPLQLRYLTTLTRLRKLSIGHCYIDTAHINALSHFTGLLELNCNANNITLDDILTLTNLTELKYQRNSSLTERRPNYWLLSRFVNLKVLDIANATIEHFSYLTSLSNLIELDISGCQSVTLPGLELLTRLTKLECLNVAGTVPPESVPIIDIVSRLTQLTSLDISNQRIRDDDLEKLTSLQNLFELRLTNNSELTWRGLRHLLSLIALRKLDLSCCQRISTLSLHYLTKLTNLRVLKVKGCPMSRDALPHLQNLPFLQKLSIEFDSLQKLDLKPMLPSS